MKLDLLTEKHVFLIETQAFQLIMFCGYNIDGLFYHLGSKKGHFYVFSLIT